MIISYIYTYIHMYIIYIYIHIHVYKVNLILHRSKSGLLVDVEELDVANLGSFTAHQVRDKLSRVHSALHTQRSGASVPAHQRVRLTMERLNAPSVPAITRLECLLSHV